MLPAVKWIDGQLAAVQILPMQIYSTDAAVFISGVVVDHLVPILVVYLSIVYLPQLLKTRKHSPIAAAKES